MPKGTVLTVDDELHVCESIQAWLKDDYDTPYALSAQEGLTIMSQREVDMVIADAVMPRIDGVEFLLLTRALNPYIPLIGISGIRTSPLYNKMKGCVDVFMGKPLDVNELRENVKRLFQKRRKPLSRRKIPYIPPELIEDENFRAFLIHREELQRDYLGQHVAFVDGKLVGNHPDRDILLQEVHRTYGAKPVFVKKLMAEEKRVIFRRPKRVRK